MSAMVRIKPATHLKLRQLAKQAGESMPDTLDRAVDGLYRKQWLEGLAEDYARLRTDKKAWAEELKERALWDKSLADGLEDR
jgi:hypothetical protein